MTNLARRISIARGLEKADLVVKQAKIFHLTNGQVEEADIAIADGVIVGVGKGYQGKTELDANGRFAVPGFIDSHIHIESTCVTPQVFERMALAHGVTTAVCDPHELANVVGTAAFDYFFACAEKMNLSMKVRISSCVPATGLETSGAVISASDLAKEKEKHPEAGLAEFMNVPGVLFQDGEVLKKLETFQQIDGHAPLFSGKDLNAYIAAGVSNDHECSTPEEAQEKINRGMQVLIREGGVARNLDDLIPVITNDNSPFLAFCTDDKKLLEIEQFGLIDSMVRRAIAGGASPLAAYRTASWSAATALGFKDRGLLAPGKRADIVLLGSLEQCDVSQVIVGGRLVTPEMFDGDTVPIPNEFLHSVKCRKMTAEDFDFKRNAQMPVIGVTDGSLLTDKLYLAAETEDVLPIAVIDRHGKNGNIGRAFVHGFRLRRGAVASSVGHDSHNICVVGTNPADMALAVNQIIDNQGGFAVASDGELLASMALPVAGLMTNASVDDVLADFKKLFKAVEKLESTIRNPFMQLSFLPLPVIPHLKLSDRGLVDVDAFQLIETASVK